ncbi:hypothetical protein CL621_03160 [archaeon]|nr:hypothetical protein [archaeon]
MAELKISTIVFRIFVIILFLEVGARFIGFIHLGMQDLRNDMDDATEENDRVYHILTLGECTTADIMGNSPWPRQLEVILNDKSQGHKFKVFNEGVGGTNTAYILSNLEENLDKYNPDMVITMMGANDYKLTIKYEESLGVKISLWLENIRVYKLGKFLLAKFENRLKNPNIVESSEENLENIWTYIELGQEYVNQRKFDEAEEMFKKAMEIDSENDEVYVGFGVLYDIQGKGNEAEEMFKKAMEIDSRNYGAYIRLGQWYRNKIRLDEAEEMFKKAMEIDSRNYQAYVELGWNYMERRKLSEAEEMFKKAMEIDPINHEIYAGLGKSYGDQGKFNDAEKIFEKAVEINPKNYEGYIRLGAWYTNQKNFNKAENILKKAIELEPNDDRAYSGLSNCYNSWGKYELAEEYSKIAEDLRLRNYNPVTRHNYQKLKEVLDQRGIKFVVVQYPMRNVESLKRIFKDKKSVVFVDNEVIFKEALKQSDYDEYFIDMFGGDFGHATANGNKLIAENVAEVILKEYF